MSSVQVLVDLNKLGGGTLLLRSSGKESRMELESIDKSFESFVPKKQQRNGTAARGKCGVKSF